MYKFQLIIVSGLSVLAFIGLFDYIVFTIKKAPCKAVFGIKMWRFAFVSLAILIYWILNGHNF